MLKKSEIQKTMPAYALCVCLALSCNKMDVLPALMPENHSIIGFSVSSNEIPRTKGIPTSSENIAALYADNIRIVAFRGTEEYIPSQQLLSPSGENGRWHTSQSYFWPENGNLDFWAWAPADLNADFNGSCSALSFSYSLPISDADAKMDAVGQRDIVLTHIAAGRETYDGAVPLAFSHPLSSIVFRGGTMRDGIIRSISLHGVKGRGDCVFDGNGFTWNVTGEPVSCTQTFNVQVSASEADQAITMEGGAMGERTFVMIPQTLGDGAYVEVVFDDGVEPKTYSHSLAGGVWKAGTTHTYTISLPSESSEEIFVEEVFDGNTVSQLSVRNDSEYNVYLRVMVEANWVDADGCIAAPCDISSDGSIDGFNVFSTGGHWTLYSDGFYYYKKAVRPGRNTLELFTSYTPGPAPVDGSHLEITVAVQAVRYDVNQKGAKAAWGNGIPITGAIE